MRSAKDLYIEHMEKYGTIPSLADVEAMIADQFDHVTSSHDVHECKVYDCSQCKQHWYEEQVEDAFEHQRRESES